MAVYSCNVVLLSFFKLILKRLVWLQWIDVAAGLQTPLFKYTVLVTVRLNKIVRKFVKSLILSLRDFMKFLFSQSYGNKHDLRKRNI